MCLIVFSKASRSTSTTPPGLHSRTQFTRILSRRWISNILFLNSFPLAFHSFHWYPWWNQHASMSWQIQLSPLSTTSPNFTQLLGARIWGRIQGVLWQMRKPAGPRVPKGWPWWGRIEVIFPHNMFSSETHTRYCGITFTFTPPHPTPPPPIHS